MTRNTEAIEQACAVFLRQMGWIVIEDRDAVIRQISDYLHIQVGMKAVKADEHAPLLLEWIEAAKEQP